MCHFKAGNITRLDGLHKGMSRRSSLRRKRKRDICDLVDALEDIECESNGRSRIPHRTVWENANDVYFCSDREPLSSIYFVSTTHELESFVKYNTAGDLVIEADEDARPATMNVVTSSKYNAAALGLVMRSSLSREMVQL